MKWSKEYLIETIQQFDLEGVIVEIQPTGSGHINDTFRAFNKHPTNPDYLLQRINDSVFKDISGMMNNIQLVLNHLELKSSSESGVNKNLKLIRTKNGSSFFKDDQNNYWRVYDYKKGTLTFDVVNSTQQAYEGAKAFGKFIYDLSDFDISNLTDTIPNFHNVPLRLEQLRKATEIGTKERLKKSQNLVTYINEIADKMSVIERLKNEGQLPIRVTHNDTKFNNVLLDENGEAYCVIDLDTVMPGVVHYDFGDGIRTSTNTASEDEQDLTKVHFDEEKFMAFTRGFLEGTNGILEPIEVNYLARASSMIPFIMSVRFLTDYLNKDVYYKTRYEEHNYDRAACQIQLTKQILSREKELDQIIQREYSQCN